MVPCGALLDAGASTVSDLLGAATSALVPAPAVLQIAPGRSLAGPHRLRRRLLRLPCAADPPARHHLTGQARTWPGAIEHRRAIRAIPFGKVIRNPKDFNC